jgi:antitoxin FitA
MPSITVKGIPEELYANLKRAAAEHRRSVNQEVIVCLEKALRECHRVDPRERLRRIDALRERMALPRLTDEILQEAKRAGRP